MRIAQAHMRHSDPRLTAGVYTDETVLPVAAAVTALPWLPTEPGGSSEAIRMTGTDGGPRAAHAQRAGRTHKQTGAKTCGDTVAEGQETEMPLASMDATLSGDLHDYSTKRVIGFEPTTFTLAT